MDAQARRPWIRGRLGWKNSEEIGLIGPLAKECQSYVDILVTNFIHLADNEEDSLCWSRNVATRDYTVKLGYEALTLENFTSEIAW